MRTSQTQSILVVRADRIGDVVLSTPAIAALRRHYRSSRVSFLTSPEAAPLLRGLDGVDEVLTHEPRGRHGGVRGFFELVKEVRERRFRIALVLHSVPRISAAVFVAGVPIRVGPWSRPHTFLFFNRGLRQRRSHVEMHEADYNLQLLRRIGVRGGPQPKTRIALPPPIGEWADSWLAERGWRGEPLVAIHPGMGGSALNWPEESYASLGAALLKDGQRVLFSGGPGEDALLERVRDSLGSLASGAIFYCAQEDESSFRGIDRLAALYRRASLVVAPSTGPLHVAVALDKPVVTFYPPIRVQSALRWGPYGQPESAYAILVPEVYCGEDFRCRGSDCHYYPCMRTLTVAQTLEAARRLLAKGAIAKEAAR